MDMLEVINTYRPISNKSMFGTFCTLGACRNARGRDARHLSSLLYQAFSSPSQSASSPVLLVPVSHPTGDLVGDQIQKENDIGSIFILPSLNLQSHLYVPSSLQRRSLLFFQDGWHYTNSFPVGSGNFSLPMSFRLSLLP